MPGGIHPPAEVLSTWPAPNVIDPPTRSKALLITAAVFGPLTLLLVLARLWARIRIQRNAGWDDWLMAVAIAPIIALTVLCTLASEVYGFNKHVWDNFDNERFIVQRKFVLAIEITFCIGAGLIKISVLLFYRRLSSRTVSPAFRWITKGTIVFIAAYSTAITLAPIFGCRPIDAFWNQSDYVKVAEGYSYKCFNEGADVVAAGLISTMQDLVTALLPTLLYWKLRIPFRQKVALFGIFAIGYGVVAIGIVRVYLSWQVFFETYDVTWVTWENWLATMLELHIGAMCANAPALKVFFKHFFQLERLTQRSKSRSNSSRQRSCSNSPPKPTTPSSFVMLSRYWKQNHNHSTKGYLGEPHTDISVDSHGGLQKDISSRSMSKKNTMAIMRTDSVNILTERYNVEIRDVDIEMVEWDTSTEDSEVQALPPISSKPPTRPATPTYPLPTAKGRSSPLSSFPATKPMSLLTEARKANSSTPSWQGWP